MTCKTTIGEYTEGPYREPCPECGYKPGSAWLYEPLPDYVLAYLRETFPGCEKAEVSA